MGQYERVRNGERYRRCWTEVDLHRVWVAEVIIFRGIQAGATAKPCLPRNEHPPLERPVPRVCTVGD